MNMNDTNTSLSSYFNDIVFRFYEDDAYMKSFGKKYGFDIDKDYFRAFSFLYPSDIAVDYQDKLNLQEALNPLTSYCSINSEIPSRQFVLADKGVVLILISHDRDALLSASREVCTKALEIVEQTFPDVFVRIGIGTVEHGLDGIELTYQNAVSAVNVGEKFKKTRRILDYIGMEIYSAINAMVLANGEALIGTILKQLTAEEQEILGKYYKCKEIIPDTAAALSISEDKVRDCLAQIKKHTGLDVNDTEDNFKLNFIMIAKRVLEKEKRRK